MQRSSPKPTYGLIIDSELLNQIIQKNDVTSKQLRKVLLALMQGDLKEARFEHKNVKAIYHYNFCTARYTQAGRLFLSQVTLNMEGILTPYFVIHNHNPDHNYRDSVIDNKQKTKNAAEKMNTLLPAIAGGRTPSGVTVLKTAEALRQLINNKKNSDEKNEQEEEKPIEAAPQWTAHSHYNGEWVELTKEQNEIAEQQLHGNLASSFLVTAPPGAGKTLSAYELIKKTMKEGKQVLYVTPTAKLAKTMLENCERSSQAGTAPTPKPFCTSYTDLLTALRVAEVQGKKPVNRQHFEEWYQTNKPKSLNININQNKKSKKITNTPDLLLEKANDFYDEFLIMGAYQTIEDYKKTGTRQTLFETPEERERLWNYHQTYLAYLENIKLFDPALLAIQIKKDQVGMSIDLVIVDECQCFSPLQQAFLFSIPTRKLNPITNLETISPIAWFGDFNQSDHKTASIGHALKNRLTKLNNTNLENEKNGKIGIIKFKYTHRFHADIATFLEKVLLIKCNLAGGKTDKDEETEIKGDAYKSPYQQHIGWIDTSDIKKTENQTAIQALNTEAKLVILVPDVSLIEKAKEFFKTPLVFTVADYIGLEEEHVIFYQPFSAAIYKEANDKLETISKLLPKLNEPGQGKSESKFRPPLDNIYRAVSRTKGTFTFCTGLRGDEAHKHGRLISALQDPDKHVIGLAMLDNQPTVRINKLNLSTTTSSSNSTVDEKKVNAAQARNQSAPTNNRSTHRNNKNNNHRASPTNTQPNNAAAIQLTPEQRKIWHNKIIALIHDEKLKQARESFLHWEFGSIEAFEALVESQKATGNFEKPLTPQEAFNKRLADSRRDKIEKMKNYEKPTAAELVIWRSILEKINNLIKLKRQTFGKDGVTYAMQIEKDVCEIAEKLRQDNPSTFLRIFFEISQESEKNNLFSYIMTYIPELLFHLQHYLSDNSIELHLTDQHLDLATIHEMIHAKTDVKLRTGDRLLLAVLNEHHRKCTNDPSYQEQYGIIFKHVIEIVKDCILHDNTSLLCRNMLRRTCHDEDALTGRGTGSLLNLIANSHSESLRNYLNEEITYQHCKINRLFAYQMMAIVEDTNFIKMLFDHISLYDKLINIIDHKSLYQKASTGPFKGLSLFFFLLVDQTHGHAFLHMLFDKYPDLAKTDITNLYLNNETGFNLLYLAGTHGRPVLHKLLRTNPALVQAITLEDLCFHFEIEPDLLHPIEVSSKRVGNIKEDENNLQGVIMTTDSPNLLALCLTQKGLETMSALLREPMKNKYIKTYDYLKNHVMRQELINLQDKGHSDIPNNRYRFPVSPLLYLGLTGVGIGILKMLLNNASLKKVILYDKWFKLHAALPSTCESKTNSESSIACLLQDSFFIREIADDITKIDRNRNNTRLINQNNLPRTSNNSSCSFSSNTNQTAKANFVAVLEQLYPFTPWKSQNAYDCFLEIINTGDFNRAFRQASVYGPDMIFNKFICERKKITLELNEKGKTKKQSALDLLLAGGLKTEESKTEFLDATTKRVALLIHALAEDGQSMDKILKYIASTPGEIADHIIRQAGQQTIQLKK